MVRTWLPADEQLITTQLLPMLTQADKVDITVDGYRGQHAFEQEALAQCPNLTRVFQQMRRDMYHKSGRFLPYDGRDANSDLTFDIKNTTFDRREDTIFTDVVQASARLNLQVKATQVDDIRHRHPDHQIIVQMMSHLARQESMVSCWAFMADIRLHGSRRGEYFELNRSTGKCRDPQDLWPILMKWQ